MSACDRLRASTEHIHRRLEATPFGSAIRDGQLGRQEYVDYLAMLLLVVSSLRIEADRCGGACDQELFRPMVDWQARLRRDLDALAPPQALTNEAATRAALRLTEQFRRHAAADPAYLVGVAYVLFGSHQGNRVLVTPLARGLGLQEDTGLSYMAAPTSSRSSWVSTRARIDASLRTPRDVEQAVLGARETFTTFEEAFAALVPGAHRVEHVRVINPDAGYHEVPVDPELLALAVAVADRAAARFPYLSLRYGDRGDRFARSDGAWLLTLCDLPASAAERQADWLCGLLSNRGIPSLCLEVHLRLLSRALSAPDAPRAAGKERLAALEQRIATRRTQVLPQARFDELAAAPLPVLGPDGGEILLSAAIDQATGVGRCADSITKWMSQDSRFSSQDRTTIVARLDAYTRAIG